jgi:hypothetical protein
MQKAALVISAFAIALIAVLLFFSCNGGGGGGSSGGTWIIINETNFPDEVAGQSLQADLVLETGKKYEVQFQFYVQSDTVLTLQPGVTVRFTQDSGIQVESGGTLIGNGTEAEPVTFTGKQETPGYWSGIILNDSNSVNNMLNYCVVQYGGGYDYYGECANLILEGSTEARIKITNCTFSHSGAHGLYMSYRASVPEFGCNTFVDNTANPVYTAGEAAHVLDNKSNYSGNGKDLVEVEYDATIDFSATWQALNVPYYIAGMMYVTDGGVLNIAPGATLKFKQDGGLEVWSEGTLTADGTSAAPITFTGLQKVKGYWKGIYIENSNKIGNILNYCVVEYGGGGDYVYAEDANVMLASSGYDVKTTVTNCTIANSGAYGICFDYDAVSADFGCNTISANEFPVHIGATLVHILDNNSDYTGNTNDRVVIEDDGAVDATVIWKKLNVPYYVNGYLWIGFNDDGHLTIAPGTTLIFKESGCLYVQSAGTLTADGTSSEMITFTGSSQVKGYWDGIYFENSDHVLSKFNYCVIEYAGNDFGGGAAGMLVFDSSGYTVRCDVTNCTLRYSDTNGIWFASEFVGTVTGNTFSDIDGSNMVNE